jgi:hypothetical protein
LRGLYRAIFAVGIVVTLAYAVAPALYGRSLNGILWAAVILALLVGLRAAEGAEVAANTILDRDDEQLERHPIRVDISGVQKLRTQRTEFVTGRQFLVTLLVLGLGLVCFLLEQTGSDASGYYTEPQWLNAFLKFDQAELYAFWFPVVAALVFAQLPSKIAAERRPMHVYANWLTQFVIRTSCWIGRTLGLALMVESGGTAEDDAEPSRLQLYEAAAAFGSGIGIEDAEMTLLIDPSDGSVRYHGRFIMKAYGHAPNSRLPQDDFWDAPILEARMTVENLPSYCGQASILGPTAIKAGAATAFGETSLPRRRAWEQAVRATAARLFERLREWSAGQRTGSRETSIHWDLAFSKPLRLHDSCIVNVTYRVAAGAQKIRLGEFDFYEYEASAFPVKKLTLTVRLDEAKNVVLREPRVSVVDTVEKLANEAEALRASRTIEALPDGYRYTINFLLQPALYTMRWQVGRRLPPSSDPALGGTLANALTAVSPSPRGLPPA